LYAVTSMPMRFYTGGTASGNERLRITATGGVTLSNGELVEKCYINSTAWSTTGTVDLDNGMVQYNSANLAGTNNTLNITSSVGINTQLATGDMISDTAITAVNATSASVQTAYNTMMWIIIVGWAIYPAGYVFGYLLGAVDASSLNLIYNLADFVNKILFGVVIWKAAIDDKQTA